MAKKIESNLYRMLQEVFVKETQLEVGDEVEIVIVAESDSAVLSQHSVPDCRNEELSRVTSIYEHGIEVEFEDESVEILPFYCLEPTGRVSEERIDPVRISDDYSAEIKPEGIKVGCQFISYGRFDELVKITTAYRERLDARG